MSPKRNRTYAQLLEAELLAREKARKRNQLRRKDPNVRRANAEATKSAMKRKREDPAFRQSEAEAKRRRRAALKERKSDTRPEFMSQDTESKYLESVIMPEIKCNLPPEDFPFVLSSPDEPVTATAQDVEPPLKLVDQVSVSEPVVPSSTTRSTSPLPYVLSELSHPESPPADADDSFLERMSADLDFHMLDEEEYSKRFEVTALGSLMKQFPEMVGALQWNCTTFASMSIEKREEKYRQAKSMGSQSSSMYVFVATNPDNKFKLPNLIMKCFFDMLNIMTILAGERIAQR